MNSTKFNNLADAHKRARIDQALAKYLAHRNNNTLAELIRTDPANDEVGLIATALELCGRGKGQACRLPCCQRCGARSRRQSARTAFKQLFGKLARVPQADEVSFYSVDGPVIDPTDQGSVERAVRAFKQRLRRIAREFPSTVWVGHLDVDDDYTLHWHGVIGHEGIRAEAITRKLRNRFTQRRAICRSEWHEDKTLAENIRNVLSYSAKALPTIPAKDGGPKYGYEVARRLGLRLSAQLLIGGFGHKGARFAINARTSNRWKRNKLFNENGQAIELPSVSVALEGKRTSVVNRRWEEVRKQLDESNRRWLERERQRMEQAEQKVLDSIDDGDEANGVFVRYDFFNDVIESNENENGNGNRSEGGNDGRSRGESV